MVYVIPTVTLSVTPVSMHVVDVPLYGICNTDSDTVGHTSMHVVIATVTLSVTPVCMYVVDEAWH